MRIVRDTGNVSALLPDGIDHIADAPYPLHGAIVAALRWLKFEELPVDEQPPKRIWFNGEEMERWWRNVERQRKKKYGDPDADDDDEGLPGVDYEENDVSLIARG